MILQKKKRKTSRLGRLKKRLEAKVGIYIRMRDCNVCQWCGKLAIGRNGHVSHVIPRSHGNALKYDEYNLKLLCMRCHLHVWHKNPLLAAEWFRSKFPDRDAYLQNRKDERLKLDESVLEQMIDAYEDKIIGIEIANDI